jgi:ATP-dependent RNA helicase RhlE
MPRAHGHGGVRVAIERMHNLNSTHAQVSAPEVPANTNTFADLNLLPELMQALNDEGYTIPTPIQTKAIPSVLAGKDLLGIAQTGTGKTAAFALPILQRLINDRRPAIRKGCRALILSPTRELATQIADSFKTYGRHTGMTTGVVFGGVGYKPQINLLSRGVDVLVATPGRLIDLMQEGHLSLAPTEILVLDEADQMMDLGFIRPLRQIVAKLSNKRQSLFFSATMPHEIGALASELLRDPVTVSVTPVAKTADRVIQRVIHVEAAKKRALLSELLLDADMSRVLIFTRTKRGADKVAKHLETSNVSSAAIHGNKSQNQREAALDGFKRGKVRVLVATDIAARGIDVDQVTHVVNFELPNIPESYVHRIGRTARAGAEGIAISLVDGEERAYLRDIERLTKNTIPSEDRRSDASLVATPAGEDRGPRPMDRSGRGGGDRRGAPRGAPRSGGGDAGRGDAGRGGSGRGGPSRYGGDNDRGAREARPAGAGGFNANPPSDRGSDRVYDPLNARPRTETRHEERRPARQDDRRPESRPASGDRSTAPTRSRFDEERQSHQSRSGPRPEGGRPESRSGPRPDARAARSDARPDSRGPRSGPPADRPNSRPQRTNAGPGGRPSSGPGGRSGQGAGPSRRSRPD